MHRARFRAIARYLGYTLQNAAKDCQAQEAATLSSITQSMPNWPISTSVNSIPSACRFNMPFLHPRTQGQSHSHSYQHASMQSWCTTRGFASRARPPSTGKEGRTERKSQKSRKVPQKSPSGATVHVLHQAHPKQTHTPGEGQELITHAARTHAKHAAQAQIVRMSPEQKLEFQEQTRRAVREASSRFQNPLGMHEDPKKAAQWVAAAGEGMIGIQRWVASQQSKAVLYDDEGEVKVQSEVDVGMHAILRTLSRAPAAEALHGTRLWLNIVQSIRPHVPVKNFKQYLDAVALSPNLETADAILKTLYNEPGFLPSQSQMTLTADAAGVQKYFRDQRFLMAFEMAASMNSQTDYYKRTEARMYLAKDVSSLPESKLSASILQGYSTRQKNRKTIENTFAVLSFEPWSTAPNPFGDVLLVVPKQGLFTPSGAGIRGIAYPTKDPGIIVVDLECAASEALDLFGCDVGSAKGVTVRLHDSGRLTEHKRQDSALDKLVLASQGSLNGEMKQLLLPGGTLVGAHFERYSNPELLPEDELEMELWRIRNKLNDSQALAVSMAVSEHPNVALLQGPPGTGKTHAAVQVIKQWLQQDPPEVLETKPKEVDALKDAKATLQTLVSRSEQWQEYRNPGNGKVSLLYTTAPMPLTRGLMVGTVVLPDGTSVEGSPQRTKKAAERAAAQACLHQLEETFPGILKASTTKTKDTKILITGHSNVSVDNIAVRLLSERETSNKVIVRLRSKSNETERDDSGVPIHELQKYDMEAHMKRHFLHGQMRDHLNRGNWMEAKYIERRMIDSILEQADVVMATCIMAGSDILSDCHFTRVLCDEATQASEPAVLVPIMRACRSLVLIGDHKQLPPTLLSDTAMRLGLGESLFGRLITENFPFRMMDTQYRMHPTIAEFPAKHIYDGALKSDVDPKTRIPPTGFDWPDRKRPVAFVETVGNEDTNTSSKSLRNSAQAKATVEVVKALLAKGDIRPADLAVITPYQGQKRELRMQMRHANVDSRVTVDTVDGYQGMEREVVVVSTVRSNEKSIVGFLRDERRFNVLMTRAKRGLIVLGKAHTLRGDSMWREWLRWVEENGLGTVHKMDNYSHINGESIDKPSFGEHVAIAGGSRWN